MRNSTPQTPILEAQWLHRPQTSKRPLLKSKETSLAVSSCPLWKDMYHGFLTFFSLYLPFVYLLEHLGSILSRRPLPIDEQTLDHLGHEADTWDLPNLFFREKSWQLRLQEQRENVKHTLVVGYGEASTGVLWSPIGAEEFSVKFYDFLMVFHALINLYF